MAYCIKNADFVNGLLEGRGWQEGDWASDEERNGLIVNVPDGGGADVQWRPGATAWQDSALIWLPTEGDALDLLGEALPRLGEGDYGWALEGANDADRYQAWIPGYLDEGTGFLDEDIYRTDGQKTPLIALLELLRAVEGKG